MLRTGTLFFVGANPALSSLPCRPFDATAALQNRMRLRCCRLLREDGEILDAYFLSNFYCLLYYLLNFSISGAILALGLLYLWWVPYRWRGHTFGKALSFAKGKVFEGYQWVLTARLSVCWH